MTQRIEMVVTVKAYPAVSKRYGEVVCVAGLRTDVDTPSWVRLYPVPFRDLEFSQRFKKYQRIRLDVTAHRSDPRPESLRPSFDTLELDETIDTTPEGWRERMRLVEPTLIGSMCDLLRRHAYDKQSLGAFRPHSVSDVLVQSAEPWSEEKAARAEQAAQPTLFMPAGRKALEQLPYKFSYKYSCSDDHCNGHTQSIIDWELGEAWRGWRAYSEEERVERIRDKWLHELCGPDRDTIFFAGNQRLYPRSFLILGVFWPPKDLLRQEALF